MKCVLSVSPCTLFWGCVDKFKPISLNNAVLNQDATFVTNCCELKAAPLFDLKAAVLSQSQVRLSVQYHSKWICAFPKDQGGGWEMVVVVVVGEREKKTTGAITKDALPNRFGRNTEFRAV